MYEPYPATGPTQGPDRIPQPRTVRNAMRLMYVGAALEVPGLIVVVVTKDHLRAGDPAGPPG